LVGGEWEASAVGVGEVVVDVSVVGLLGVRFNAGFVVGAGDR